jgi:acetoin utilization protein AcuC
MVKPVKPAPVKTVPAKTALVYSTQINRYDLGANHPFKAIRPEATRSLLEHAGLLTNAIITPQTASLEDALSVHARAYTNRVMAASRGDAVPDHLEYGIGTPDTPIFANMHEATLGVVGATLTAAKLVADGTYPRALNLAGGLHHAHRDKGSGFCVYNDLSVAIAHLRSQGLRVAYLDVDAHHGDGVQFLHYEDPNVLTISLHETGRYLFPGTGHTYELGRGAGLGTSLNVPLEPYTQDASFLEALERVLEPALRWFRPDVLVLQAGADAHQFDPLADLAVTVQGFAQVFARTVELAEAFAGGKIIATGGGGYATWTVVPRVWATLYATLEGQQMPEQVPAAWLAQWQSHSDEPLPVTMRDVPLEVPRQAQIDAQNSKTVSTLLEDWRRVIATPGL